MQSSRARRSSCPNAVSLRNLLLTCLPVRGTIGSDSKGDLKRVRKETAERQEKQGMNKWIDLLSTRTLSHDWMLRVYAVHKLNFLCLNVQVYVCSHQIIYNRIQDLAILFVWDCGCELWWNRKVYRLNQTSIYELFWQSYSSNKISGCQLFS